LRKASETWGSVCQAAAQDLLPLVQQAQVLGWKFDAVVANPPYMGGKGMNPALKDYAKAPPSPTAKPTCLPCSWSAALAGASPMASTAW
jgi:hypothetical protein